MNRQAIKSIVIISTIFIVSALASYILFNRPSNPASESPASAPQSASQRPTTQNPPRQTTEGSDSFFSEVFRADESTDNVVRTESWTTVSLRVMVRLTLAALLTAGLAFRPRRFSVLFKRNLFVAQTQILLAVVASSLMMIVGDSAARAFGIFAAVSLVRFRTNIKDPKEVTVLLVSLAIGLATGIGRWELAAILCLFVLALLWVLEYREQEMVFRSLDLKIRTLNLDETHQAIKSVLQQHNFSSEIRALNREDEQDPFASIVFCVEMSPLISTDQLSEEILTADHKNIDSIEWVQQKSSANAFQ